MSFKKFLSYLIVLVVGLIIGNYLTSIKSNYENNAVIANKDSIAVMLYEERLRRLKDSSEYVEIINQCQEQLYKSKSK